MSAGTCSGCKRMTNSATSNWWHTEDHIPTKCFIAWENNTAVHGCAWDNLSPNAQILWQNQIDTWNKNSKKTIKEHLEELQNFEKKSKHKKRKHSHKQEIEDEEQEEE